MRVTSTITGPLITVVTPVAAGARITTHKECTALPRCIYWYRPMTYEELARWQEKDQ